jgi:uncharacterized protein CbrC (UPF0167 family)
VRGWEYKRNVYCVGEKPKHLCPWCIADGSWSEKYADESGRNAILIDTLYEFVRDADGVITGVQPDFLPGCTVPDNLQAEVAHRTPAFLTWQEPMWLACCSTPAQYLGQPTGEELTRREGLDDVVESLVATSHWDADTARDRLASVGPDESEVVYLFQCSHCKRLLASADMS